MKSPIAPVYFFVVFKFKEFDKSPFFESILLRGAYKLAPIFLMRVFCKKTLLGFEI